ncbi:MAG: PqqD family protein [Anaerolineales bacterium]|nr:PqqD family protein [Anaerolineales bacterium]MDW8448120.1 PqqD family protein [Anaerolineales bacterium]
MNGSDAESKEALVILPSKNQVKVVNEVGAFILRLIDGQHTVRQIIESVYSAYAAPLEQIEEDVVAFFEQLSAQGVITLREEPSSE